MIDKKEKNSKQSEEQTNEGFNLDGILSELGSFGKYQLLLLLLLAFRDSFLDMCNFNYMFTAREVAFRCEVLECEMNDHSINASWTRFAFANNSAICQKLHCDSDADLANGTNNGGDFFLNQNRSCSPEMFDANKIVPCEKVIYEDYNSIVAEFDLGCEPWKRTMIGTVHNMGLVFSFILSGLISDRYGRKVIIVGTPLMVGIAGILKSFSVNYWMLLVLEFFETALGYGNASLVLALESVTQKNRVVFSCMSDILSSFGAAFFGLIAWKIPYWRHMMRAIYAPLLIVVFYIFLVDEGVRWLLAHDKNDEAVRVLNKVAKINNITLSHKAKAMVKTMSEEKLKCDSVGKPESQDSNLMQHLRSRTILGRVCLIALAFFCCMFVYNGVIINSTNISGNEYLNFSVIILASIPTRIITALTLTRYGRKTPICVAYVLCCICFLTSAFVPKSIGWASVAFYIVGKMCNSYGIFSMTVVALEIFPTTARNSLTNVSNTFGRLGSILAPQTPLLEKYMHGLASLTFAGVSLIAAVLALMLPDTNNTKLPDKLSDAENLEKLKVEDATEASDGKFRCKKDLA